MADQTPDEKINAKRGPDGRFLKGNRPPYSGGRPPGATSLKARAARLASDRLEAMLGKASAVINQALDDGDADVARWLIDRIRPPKNSDFVSFKILSELNTPQEAVEAAREAVQAAGRGEISMTEARAYVALLERLGGMQGYLELERLRAMIEELKPTAGKSVRVLDQSHFPPESRIQWGQGVRKSVNRES